MTECSGVTESSKSSSAESPVKRDHPIAGARQVDVPTPGASVEEILEFAATYDAYEHLADNPEHLGNVGCVARHAT